MARTSGLGILFLIAIAFVVGVPLLILDAYVAVRMWDWFVVPAGLPHVGIQPFIGVSFILAVIRYKPASDTKEDTSLVETAIRNWALSALMALVFLAQGWLVHAFLTH